MQQKGFTLVELAIVLIVIGLLIGVGAGLIGPMIKQAKYSQSRDIVTSAKQSLLGYTVQNGFSPSSSGDPFGTAGARALDAWQNNLIYNVATLLNGSGNVCGVTATDLTVFECTNPACTTSNTKSNIAFIVYSKGADANDTDTTTQPAGGPACASGTCRWIRQQGSSYSVGPANYNYDDIVQYGSLDEIRSASGCPTQLSITSSTILQTGVEDTYYSTQMQATGGIPPYTWSVSGQALGGLGCSATSYPLANPNTGKLCLYTTGLLAGTINVNTATNTGELTTCSATITVPPTLTVTDSAPTVNGTVTFAGGNVPVNPQPMRITTNSLPNAPVNVAYPAVQFNATGGYNSSSTWSVVAGALPAGMSLSAGGNLSGTPTVSGTFNFTVQVADSCVPPDAASAAFSFIVTP